MARASLAIAVVGTALLVVGPRGVAQLSGRFGLGALLALGAGVSYALHAVAAKGVLSRVAPLSLAAITFTLAAAFLSPALVSERAPLASLAANWPLLLYLGVGPTAVAYVLFTTGLGRVSATAAGIVSLIEPLTATLLGVMGFGESLGALGVIGALMLLASFALLAAGDRRTPPDRAMPDADSADPPERPQDQGSPNPAASPVTPATISRPRGSRRD